MENQEINVNGTLVWYYFICPRRSGYCSPDPSDEDNANVNLGRYTGLFYPRERKEILVGHSKMDVFRVSKEGLIVGEVKKSSRYRDSARMQLAFYLSELKQRGIVAKGELRFPREKRKEEVILDGRMELELDRVRREILRILYMPGPPVPIKINFCKKCAYAEFCWS